MAMNNPVHPGAIVREDCLKPLGLSISEGAKRLGVGRQTLSNLVNEKASVSIEMAYRLSKAFGSTPETWLSMQLAFDLARSRDLEAEDQGRTNRRRVDFPQPPRTSGIGGSLDNLRDSTATAVSPNHHRQSASGHRLSIVEAPFWHSVDSMETLYPLSDTDSQKHTEYEHVTGQ